MMLFLGFFQEQCSQEKDLCLSLCLSSSRMDHHGLNHPG